jgi:hypothetical protein
VVVLVFSHRDPPQVRRLVDRLREGNDVFVGIHHDPVGEPLVFPAMSDVALVPDPLHCPWGGYEVTVAMVHSLRWAVATVPELSWVLLISGQDYPAMPVRQMEHELRTSPHDAFVRHFRIDDDPALDVHHWQALTRRRYFNRRRFPRSARSYPWPRRHPFVNGRHAYVGDVWVNLGAEAVHQVLDDDAWMRQLFAFMRAAPNADELALPSLLLNGQQHLDVVSDRRRYLRFARGEPHPATLTEADIDEIVASDAFFARKFSAAAPAVLDRLDEHIRG